MSRKHFQTIADALKASKPEQSASVPESFHALQLAVWETTVRNVAAGCSEHNANFNMERFLTACGL